MATHDNEMTREGYEALQKELDHLVAVTRKENAERLKEAISYGDISENSEYDAAKDAQAETEERITTIEAMLRTAKIADEDETPDEGVIATGRTVTLHDLIYDEEVTYKIVGNTEADPFNGKLSNASAVGQHLLGARAGDVLEFPVIDGTAKYKVLDVRK